MADFRPQILFKIKQNVVKTLVNSDLYPIIIKKGHFSLLAEKILLGYSNSEHPDSFHHETTASITSKVVVCTLQLRGQEKRTITGLVYEVSLDLHLKS